MEKEQILKDIAKYEKALTNKDVSATGKAGAIAKIETLKAQLLQAEQAVEEKAIVAEEEEEETQEEVQAEIEKLEKLLDNPKIPDAKKPAIKAKIESAKKKLSESKAEQVEDKKEAVAEKKEIKEAVKKIVDVTKKVTAQKKKKAKAIKEKAPPSKIPEVKIPKIEVPEPKHKEREEKSKKRNEKLSDLMKDLRELIKKHKGLEKYKGEGVDLERDAKRIAKPFGWRFRGEDDYRDPKKVLTAEQFAEAKAEGKLDYEGRANRSDRFAAGVGHRKPTQKGHPENKGHRPILAKGGDIHDKQADGQRFAKPAGWRWKNKAFEDGLITKAQLSKHPTEDDIAQFGKEYVYQESRVDKSDKKPSRKYISL
jgi:hypothetical protein